MWTVVDAERATFGKHPADRLHAQVRDHRWTLYVVSQAMGDQLLVGPTPWESKQVIYMGQSLQHIEADTNWMAFCRQHFQIHFLERKFGYSQTFNIRCTKSQNLNVSRLVLQLSLPNPLKPGVKSRMKM